MPPIPNNSAISDICETGARNVGTITRLGVMLELIQAFVYLLKYLNFDWNAIYPNLTHRYTNNKEIRNERKLL